MNKELKVIYVSCETCNFTVIFTSDNRTFFYCKKDKIGLNLSVETENPNYNCYSCDKKLERYDLYEEDNVCPICNGYLSVMYGHEQFSKEEVEKINKQEPKVDLFSETLKKSNPTSKEKQKISEVDFERLLKPAFDLNSPPEKRKSAIHLLELTKALSPKQISELRASIKEDNASKKSSKGISYDSWAFTFLAIFSPFLVIYASTSGRSFDVNIVVYALIISGIVALFLAPYIRKAYAKVLNKLQALFVEGFRKIRVSGAIVIVLVTSVLLLFYWFQWKPAEIRKSCAEEAMARQSSTRGKNNFYRYCLTQQGLKPESLFVNVSE